MSQSSSYKAAKIPAGVSNYPEAKPQLDPKLVKIFVSVAHGDFGMVQEMIANEPELLNASWDWGDGDFENALEAAGHMGRRDIALFLISKGARVNLFCSAMLGHLEVVKAILEANPNLKDSKGAHGLTLLHHAKVGGEESKTVLEYVHSLE